MRVVVAAPGPAFSVYDAHVGWCEALRELGCHVIDYNLAERLTFYGSVLMEAGPATFRRALSAEQATDLAVNGIYSTLYKARPDLLLVISGFFYPTEVYSRARAQGTRVVIVHTESPYEDQRQMELAPYADLNLIDDPTNFEAFKAIAPTMWLPRAYRPSIHHPGEAKPDLVSDFAFVGTGYPSRVRFFEAMDLRDLDVLLAGNWQDLDDDSPLKRFVGHDVADCLDNADTADVYRSTKVGINLYRREAEAAHLGQGMTIGPREIEMAACRTFFLRDPRPESDELFDFLPAFAGPADAETQLREWLPRTRERVELAERARQVIADRTFTNQAAVLLRQLETRS